MQKDPKGSRGKWIVAMLEYDLEIKPTKLIKGQGLEKMMEESNLHVVDINMISALFDEEVGLKTQVSQISLSSPWYANIFYVIQHLNFLEVVSKSIGRSLKLKASKYCILDNVLYWKDPGGVLLNCLIGSEAKEVMSDFHKGDCGIHLY